MVSLRKLLKISILPLFWASALSPQPVLAAGGEGGASEVSEVIMHHVTDDHVWHFADGLVLPLPVIVYSDSTGLAVFSSGNFFNADHAPAPYQHSNGVTYQLEHGHVSVVGSTHHLLDLSITKNVAMLFINVALIMFVFTRVAAGYKRNRGKAPSGIQSFLEPVILFVKDEVIRPNVGPRYEKYLPYLLTLFFFILFGNLLGLLPGAANLTGNIAVTATLAFFTFLITNFSGNKAYWSHIFWTPGVPLPLRVIILPVEIIGIFTKPFSLMVRLFAAITAGHIVMLSLLSLTFIFHSWGAGVGASIFVIVINLIELLVAGIQAYVFTLFTSLYIGLAIEEHDHH
ncbi:MAG: F0F1 ATP synthase subunit A [Bacteroidota bacterium]